MGVKYFCNKLVKNTINKSVCGQPTVYVASKD